jgi:methylenetetrahydrofolate dehydrogenase (NADP+)/methenyltetrahydrofolate cyclohydrolase
MIIDGKLIAATILNDLKTEVEKLKERGIIPQLYIILLSDNPSSASYVKQKLLKGDEIGAKITIDKENENITTEELINKITLLNNDPKINGIIVQRPMPNHLNEEEVASAIIPQKDIDGFNKNSNFQVPIAMAIFKLLSHIHPDDFDTWLKSKRITVIGNGITAGRPIISALEKIGINPQIITSQTTNRADILKNSEVIISAVGKENIVNTSNITKGVILIGVGQHRGIDDKLHGDYDDTTISDKASSYTPTIGGVGPVNIACLMTNLINACEKA